MFNFKKTNILRYICLMCAMCILFSFASCNTSDDEQETELEKYYTISFNTNGGTQIESIRVKEKKYATRPEDPTLDNYVFRRWERDGREWHFESKPVTDNMTLTALWVSAVELFELVPDETTGGLMIGGFKKHASFQTLNMPSTINGKTVVGIADSAFYSISTDHAVKLIIPESVVWVGEEAFADSSEVAFDIRGTLTHIGEASFKSCALLEKISLGNGIDKIPFMAFFGCSSLKTINLPEGVVTIEENAFEGCSAMRTIVLPSTLTAIQDSAFVGCNSLVSIFFGGSEEQFDAIEIAESNDPIINANVYFYSETQPTEQGNFWHYEDGTPIIWQ